MHEIYVNLEKDYVDKETKILKDAGWTADMLHKFFSYHNDS